MSFLAKLNLDEEEFNVLDCEFEASRGSDPNGQPNGIIRMGAIKVLLEYDPKVHFFRWLTTKTMVKNGELTFFKRNNISSLEKVEFKNAHCLYIKKKFNSEDNRPLRIALSLSAEEITVRGVTHANDWTGSKE